jgi:hypothetical protein
MMKIVQGIGIAQASTKSMYARRMKVPTTMKPQKTKMITTMAVKVGRVTMTGTHGMMIGADLIKHSTTLLNLLEI